MKNKKKLFLFLAIITVIVLGLQAWNDTDIFTATKGGKGKSNVVLIQDHTGSMCAIIYHPDFNPKTNYSSYSTVTLANNTDSDMNSINKTLWYIRWVNNSTIQTSTGGIQIKSWTALTNLLVLSTGNTTAPFKKGDWILQYYSNDEYNINYQMVAKIADNPSTSGSGNNKVTNLTLDPTTIKGTPNSASNYKVYYYSNNSSSYTIKVVKLYGTTIDQCPSGGYDVAYTMDPDKHYLRWIFGVANETQRQQITNFSTLAYDIEYNGYLRSTPVSPANAFALNPDNSDKTETLLEEWNRVMKEIYPIKIANLSTNGMTASTTTITYNNAKGTFKNYVPGGFYIKIDAETMQVTATGHVPGTDPLHLDEGQLTVTRGLNNTVAAAHPVNAAIMIYNDTGLGIDEYTPVTNLFSSLQHVDEPTGDVNTSWTESKTFKLNGTNVTRPICWRYKRVFTRIQVAREALCDVVTAKDKLLPVASLAAAVTNDTDTTLTYANAGTYFDVKAAPFYIKVSDPADLGSDEIMKVTALDPVAYTLTVTRGQQGTIAHTHNINAAVMTFTGARDLVRFGIFKFSSGDSTPATKIVDLNDFGQKYTDGTYKTAAYVNTAILDKVDILDANGGTPLARALTYVWSYLKPNIGSGTGDYLKTGISDWKAIDETTFGNVYKFETLAGATHLSPKGSPMEYWCQENYAVLITDGEATADSGNMSYGVFGQTNQKTLIAAGIFSDFFKFDYNNTHHGPSRWGDAVNDSTEYLTDVAYFLFHQDMFPTSRIRSGVWDSTNYFYTSNNAEPDTALYKETDPDAYQQWPGNQNIKTYTVGLCVANTVLPKAAKNGGGSSFTASNYRDLSAAFLSIINSVELTQVPMTYTTYAAPKQSITEGNYGYIAHFIPQNGKSMWEGHLRRFRLGFKGEFPSNVDSKTEEVYIDEKGTLKEVSFKWDAGEILNTRTTDRVVFTTKPSAPGVWPSLPINFMTSGSIGATELDVTTATQVSTVKYFIQNFNKADGINANSDYKGLYRLGETYHFNPQLVSYPLAWKANSDISYKSFYDHYADDNDPDTAPNPTARTEVVYAGANDGKLHCFQASNGNELWSYVPYSHLKKLKITVPTIGNGEHAYFVDGKSLVKDIKVAKTDGTFNNDYTDWKTGLFFGMGMGGRSYCALDVTNPTDLKVLWETEDDAETVTNGNMGYTEAKPVVVDMYGGTTLKHFPGIILAGGYNEAEVQATDPDLLIAAWKKREGKALYILNANSGKLVKKFIYGTPLDEGGSATNGYVQTNPGFLTAMTAAPAVFDSNNDGLADVIYLAETGDYKLVPDPPLLPHGGAIWKINCYGDPANWTAQKIYQADAGQTIFISPSLAYDNDYRVWVMFGTGRRPNPVNRSPEGGYLNLTGQFVAFIDDSSGTVKTNSNLYNVTTSGSTEYTIDDNGTVKKGFFFNFLLPSEIMFEPAPLYINNQVLFMTFAPKDAVGGNIIGDPCGDNSAANGSHYIYQFDFSAQGNTFTLSGFLIEAGKILGYGPMGDDFIVYKGAGDAGNFKPDASAMKTYDLSDPNSGMFWKEDKK